MNAGGVPHEADEQLMQLTALALSDQEAVPAEVVAAAKAAWTWRTIDAELAELAHDSSLDDAPVGVRGAATLRALSFTSGPVAIEVEVSEEHGRRGLVGQVMPAPAGDAGPLVIEGVDGRAVEVPVDELGRFVVDRLDPGLIRLRIGTRVVTEWVTI